MVPLREHNRPRNGGPQGKKKRKRLQEGEQEGRQEAGDGGGGEPEQQQRLKRQRLGPQRPISDAVELVPFPPPVATTSISGIYGSGPHPRNHLRGASVSMEANRRDATRRLGNALIRKRYSVSDDEPPREPHLLYRNPRQKHYAVCKFLGPRDDTVVALDSESRRIDVIQRRPSVGGGDDFGGTGI